MMQYHQLDASGRAPYDNANEPPYLEVKYPHAPTDLLQRCATNPCTKKVSVLRCGK